MNKKVVPFPFESTEELRIGQDCQIGDVDEILRAKPELVKHLDLYMNMYVSHKRRENKNLKSSFFALTEFVEFSRIVSDGAASFLKIRLNSKYYEMFKKYATSKYEE
eukprot:CAMPEP_0168611996 /NCGR_PEP_ID=MMETSP0449_2-20121227/2667_1 /TAXON_ID=1082188 /ORGANISM="Strombidium rassoulzadegani, Strain ras09" /LENGTH=106 /DNA_ID=CAMNT_0008652503 /DNA_START=548 /DNA_END=868 /DNA_ORIENTATION=-